MHQQPQWFTGVSDVPEQQKNQLIEKVAAIGAF